MVPQVPIIGILMIVNGVLCILYGFFEMSLGPLVQASVEMQAQVQGQAQPPPQVQQMQVLMPFLFWYYIAIGIINGLAGLINIVAGIPTMRYRSRVFVIVALCTNLGTLPGCSCLPTSLGLMIWGLVVLFQKDVAEAFRMGAAGRSVDEIKRRFADADRRRGDDYDERDDRASRRDRGEAGPPPGDPPKGPDQGEDGIREL